MLLVLLMLEVAELLLAGRYLKSTTSWMETYMFGEKDSH